MTTSTTKKNRVSEITILKGLALLAVIFQSSISSSLESGNMLMEDAIMMGILYNFGKFSAPTFIFITGFILLYQKQNSMPYRSFILNKTADILVPLFFWTLVYFSLLSGEPLFTLDWFIGVTKATALGTAAPHLWYVVMVFQFHLLFPLFKKLFQTFGFRSKPSVLFLTVGLGYMVIMWFSHRYIFNGTSLTNIPWLTYTDRSFLAYSFYFILGGYAALHFSEWRRFALRSIPVNTFVFIALFIWIGYELIGFSGMDAIHLDVSTYLKPSMFLYVVSEIILLYSLALIITKSRSLLFSFLQFFGRYSFGAFLSHYLWLIGVTSVLNGLDVEWSIFATAGIVFVFTSLFSITFAYMISGAPFARYMIGHFDKLQMNWNWETILNTQHLPSIKQKK